MKGALRAITRETKGGPLHRSRAEEEAFGPFAKTYWTSNRTKLQRAA